MSLANNVKSVWVENLIANGAIEVFTVSILPRRAVMDLYVYIPNFLNLVWRFSPMLSEPTSKWLNFGLGGFRTLTELYIFRDPGSSDTWSKHEDQIKK